MNLILNYEKDDVGLLAKSVVWAEVLEPTLSWSGRQIAWIVLQTVVGTIICFGASFGICTLAYMGHDAPTTFGPLDKSPVAGSFAVTIGLQTLLNWIISGSLMTLDVLKGRVAPRAHGDISWWPTTGTSKAQYFNLCGLLIQDQTDNDNNTATAGGICHRLLAHVKRAGPWFLLGYLTVFPIFTLACYLLFDGEGVYSYGDFPTPEILTGCVAVVLVWLMTPIWSMSVLIYIGEHYQLQNNPIF
jgi:hypothetical protein